MDSIRVSVDDLLSKLQSMYDDGYATVELTLNRDGYESEIEVKAVSFDSEDPIDYGIVPEIDDEF